MNKTEFKRELSKVTGIDFFSPRYREIINKYFPEEKDAEEERLEEISETEEKVEEINENNEEKVEEIVENNETEEEKAEEVVEEETEEVVEDAKEDAVEEVVENNNDELLDAKLELALLKANVRDDKMEAAKRFMKYEIKDVSELEKVNEILKDYPEWIKVEQPIAQKIGMAVDEAGDNLTEEEKRLKAMGINPRD